MTQLINHETGRFSLDENAQIFFQKDATNPLPGDVVATLSKGDNVYAPKLSLIDPLPFEVDGGVQGFEVAASTWLTAHIDTLLGGILRFAAADGLPDHMRDIAQSLKEHLGVVERYKIENALKALDADQRRIVRQHKVRLGPLLIFFTELLKPAALQLKSLLWALDTESSSLPLARPKDGIVSQIVTEERPDHQYYRALGYPIFAGRMIRIDMLDRVVTDIYEQADKGRFQAQHKYAEWLGCGIDDLYAVLGALGHHKIEDPAEQQAKEAEAASANAEGKPKNEVLSVLEQAQSGKKPATEAGAETKEAPEAVQNAEEEAPKQEVASDSQAQPSAKEEASAAQQEKPALAIFMLKKGKLSEAPRSGRAPKRNNQKQDQFADIAAEGGAGKPRPKKHKKKQKGQADKARIYTAEAKQDNDEDNPFAVLKAMQFGGDKK